MSKPASSGKNDRSALKAVNRRAEAILKARPAYREMLDFYLTIFRRQIEWRDRLVVHPEEVGVEQVRESLRKGTPLIQGYDPGVEPQSLLDLWTEMKEVFRRGNEVLRGAVEKIDRAEEAGDFAPASWLLEQRPERWELVADASGKIGIEESVLATLSRAATFPHWELVAESWLPQDSLEEWRRFCCPVCGGVPGLVENRKGQSGREGISASPQRFMHCSFCGSRWAVPALKCPACGSTKEGDAKYLFTSDEPELRIDFCKSCHHYIKVIDGDKISGRVHVGLELLTAAHLDAIAQDKNLSPLEVCA